MCPTLTDDNTNMSLTFFISKTDLIRYVTYCRCELSAMTVDRSTDVYLDYKQRDVSYYYEIPHPINLNTH